MKKLIFLLFVFSSFLSFAYNNLRVINPEQGFWYHFPAVIDKAEITIRPVGSFVEYNLYLTFSANNTENESSDTQLEVIMDFELPANSIIIDSWLWIGGIPKQADILDRWTATNIYEEIVNRRKDPSLLVKNGTNQYSINIYPMKPDESRKIKITYLSPAKYIDADISVDIPSNIFNLSTVKLNSIDAYFLPSIYYTSPSSQEISVETITHNEFGECYKATVKNESFSSHNFILENHQDESIKSISYTTNDEAFYQISFTPSDVLNETTPQNKICYLIDYDNEFHNESQQVLLGKIQNILKKTLSANDKFNVIFSNLSLNQAFAEWKYATSTSIDQAFEEAKLSNYSNLAQLIAKGINFVNEQGEEGKIVLITNNNAYESYQNSNEIIHDLNSINSNHIPINIIDYTSNYYNNYWINNTIYYGNGYLFSNLARTNSGEYIYFIDKLYSQSFDELLEKSINEVSDEIISNIDIYTRSNNGFCYGRMNVTGGLSNSYKLNKAIHQVGKYNGDYPNELEVSFEMKGNVYHTMVPIPSPQLAENDSLIQTIWNGIDIIRLEQQENTSQVINEIIYQSIENRILSRYTAFLCVEDSIDICEDCGDEWIEDKWTDDGDVVIGVDELESKPTLGIYPNPFTNHIQIELPELDELLELKIFNMMGQCVKIFEINKFTYSYSWNGENNQGIQEKEGIYLIVATYAKQRITTKIIKQ